MYIVSIVSIVSLLNKSPICYASNIPKHIIHMSFNGINFYILFNFLIQN